MFSSFLGRVSKTDIADPQLLINRALEVLSRPCSFESVYIMRGETQLCKFLLRFESRQLNFITFFPNFLIVSSETFPLAPLLVLTYKCWLSEAVDLVMEVLYPVVGLVNSKYCLRCMNEFNQMCGGICARI